MGKITLSNFIVHGVKIMFTSQYLGNVNLPQVLKRFSVQNFIKVNIISTYFVAKNIFSTVRFHNRVDSLMIYPLFIAPLLTLSILGSLGY